MCNAPRHVAVSLLLGMLAGGASAQTASVGDPLRPSTAVAADGAAISAPSLPTVSMIVIRGTTAYALIDGAVRRNGDRFNGYRLDRIAPTQVTLVRDDATSLTVPLLPTVRAKLPLDHKP